MNTFKLNSREIIEDQGLDRFCQGIEKTKRLYFHSYCPDGILGRNILLKYVNFENMDNQDFLYPVTPYKPLTVVENALFVDSCPESNVLEAFLKAGAKILDHHSSRFEDLKKYMVDYPDQILLGENDLCESGAVLAYKVALKLTDSLISNDDHDAMELAGIADCFKKEDSRFDKARAQAFFVSLLGNSYYDIPNYHDLTIASLMFKTDMLRTEALKKHCLIMSINNVKVAFYNGDSSISDLAELLRKDGVNLVVGWEQRMITLNGVEDIGLTVSLRSDESVAANRVACFFPSGGGHDRAAGFRLHTTRSIHELIDEALVAIN